jgi:hypothetical protein
MINLIKASHDTKTLRTIMEETMNYHAQERDFFFERLVTNLASDTIPQKETIRALLNERAYFMDKILVTEGYLEENNFDNAFNILTELKESKLDEAAEKEVSNMLEYLTLRETWALAEKSIYALSPADVEDLVQFVESHTGRGRLLAKNILCVLYNICIEDPMGEPKNMTVPHITTQTGVGDPEAGKVTVMPNPAKDYTSFAWDFGSFDGTAILTIVDPTGKPILTHPLTSAQGQWTWDTRKLNAGTYLFSASANGISMGSGKIVIAK